MVCPLDQSYEWLPVPPEAVRLTVPSDPPLQDTSVIVSRSILSAVDGSVIVVPVTPLQPSASVTVTLYVPALKLSAIAVVAPLLQLKVSGAVPPHGVAVAEPSLPPRPPPRAREKSESGSGEESS